MKTFEIKFMAQDYDLVLTKGTLIRQFSNEGEAREYAEYNLTFEEIVSIKEIEVQSGNLITLEDLEAQIAKIQTEYSGDAFQFKVYEQIVEKNYDNIFEMDENFLHIGENGDELFFPNKYCEYDHNQKIEELPPSFREPELINLELIPDEFKLVLHALAIAEKKIDSITTDYATNIQYVRGSAANNYIDEITLDAIIRQRTDFVNLFNKIDKAHNDQKNKN